MSEDLVNRPVNEPGLARPAPPRQDLSGRDKSDLWMRFHMASKAVLSLGRGPASRVYVDQVGILAEELVARDEYAVDLDADTDNLVLRHSMLMEWVLTGQASLKAHEACHTIAVELNRRDPSILHTKPGVQPLRLLAQKGN